MDAISLTTFVDFVSKSGTPKMTVVREWKHRDEYDPLTDYWKTLREAIIAVHKKRHGVERLEAVAAGATVKKIANYALCAKAYKKWIGKRTLPWFEPPKLEWKSGGIRVQINPELGLEIDGKKHLVKLYFREQALPANRAVLALQAMHEAASKLRSNVAMGLLDIRKGKLHTISAPAKEYGDQLFAEAAYWAAIYPRL